MKLLLSAFGAIFMVVLPARTSVAAPDRMISAVDFDDKVLRFFDDSGNIAREMRLAKDDGSPAEEVRRIKRRNEPLDKEEQVEQKINRRGSIAKSRKAALVAERAEEYRVSSSTDGKERFTRLGSVSAVEYWNYKGKAIWRKELRRNNEVFEMALDDFGGVTYVIEGCNFGCDRKNEETRTRLRVFDRHGEELLIFSGKQRGLEVIGGRHIASSDGRYIFIECRTKTSQLLITVVIDTSKSMVWQAPDLINVFGVLGDHARVERVSIGMLNGKIKKEKKSEKLNLKELPWEAL